MKVEFVSRQIIKPSSPTPDNLRNYKLSFHDQFSPPIYTKLLFSYPNNIQNSDDDDVPKERIERLKTSLSETLRHFYPFAGRVKDGKVIECNDEGAEFCETRAHGFLSDILKNPDVESVPQFVPVEMFDIGSGSLLKVQVTLFDCGGLGIGASFSHKIADASTIGSFMKAWSCIAVGTLTESMLPKYVLGSLYPSTEFLNDLPPFEIEQADCINRRYVFDSSKISKLKAEAASQVVDNPTRVEAVLALIWKCALKASRTNLGPIKSHSILSQVVNVRKRTNPPLPVNSVGNFTGFFSIKPEETNNDDEDNSTEEVNLQGIVIQLRKGLEQFLNFGVKKLLEKDAFVKFCGELKDWEVLLKKEVIELWVCSSWCRVGFYELDFGWGKPKLVSVPPIKRKNLIVLMDTSDGKGIEALVSLTKEDMILMESDKNFLEFASINPSII